MFRSKGILPLDLHEQFPLTTKLMNNSWRATKSEANKSLMIDTMRKILSILELSRPTDDNLALNTSHPWECPRVRVMCQCGIAILNTPTEGKAHEEVCAVQQGFSGGQACKVPKDPSSKQLVPFVARAMRNRYSRGMVLSDILFFRTSSSRGGRDEYIHLSLIHI